jgi:pimeloyl-ACP methyl ester carboxylesterase
MDDPAYKERVKVFDSWYENPLDLPGHWYLRAIRELFKENRLAKGEFVGLGRRLDLKSIACPLYLLAGESDDITTREQVFAAENLVGTPKSRIEKKLVPRRAYRSLHGLAHAQGDMADDRAVANSFRLRLTLGGVVSLSSIRLEERLLCASAERFQQRCPLLRGLRSKKSQA